MLLGKRSSFVFLFYLLPFVYIFFFSLNAENLCPLDIALMTNNIPMARMLLLQGARESPLCEFSFSHEASVEGFFVCVYVCVCLIDWSYLLSYPFAAAFLSFFPSLRVHENRILIISWSGCLWTKSIHTLCNTRDTEPVTARQSVKSEETSQWSVRRLDIKINSQCIKACNHTQASITKKTSYKIACGFRPTNSQNESKIYFVHHSKNNDIIYHLRQKSLQSQV